MKDMISKEMDISKKMATRKTILWQKDPGKENAVDNYNSILFLLLMWKIITGIIANTVCVYLEMYNYHGVERKGCGRNSRGTKYQLLIDKMVLNGCKKRQTNLEMSWIGYMKVDEMIAHFWIFESTGSVQVFENNLEFIRKSMKNWNTNLTSCVEYLANVNIRRRIFQGDSFSPLLFVICMTPLKHILRKLKLGYTLKNGERLNHLFFVDDLEAFAKSELEVNGLVSTVQILSNDIGIEFSIKKCDVIELKRGKVVSSGRVEMPDVKRIKEVEKNGYTYLSILEYKEILESKMKEKFKSEYLRRTKLVMKSRLYDRHKIIAINTWALSLIGYSASFVKWTKIKLDEIDGKTRKVMALNKELHPTLELMSTGCMYLG